MEYADIIVAVVGAFALAWIADQLAGRRGLFATLLVSGIGGLCGWFLAVRVFAVSTMDDWLWVGAAMVAAAVSLFGFFLFRNKR